MSMRGGRAGRSTAGASVVALGVLGLIVLGVTGAARAQAEAEGKVTATQAAPRLQELSAAPDEDFPRGEPQVTPLWKLGRGLHNLAFGLPAELVKNPVIEALKGDTVFAVGAGVTEGVLVGIGKGFWRMGAGFLDVVTFPAASVDPWYHPVHLQRYPF